MEVHDALAISKLQLENVDNTDDNETAEKEKDDEDMIAEPKMKDPVFPETQLNLMTFKTFFVNEKS